VETPQELFRAAAELVDRGLAQLDLREHPRLPGAPRRFLNFMHAKVGHRLVGTPRKLRQSADRLDAKARHAPQGALDKESGDETI
jgi:hypothetical protein